MEEPQAQAPTEEVLSQAPVEPVEEVKTETIESNGEVAQAEVSANQS